MPVERAVHRLTGEIADWLGVHAGRIAPCRRADLAVIDPSRLDATLDDQLEAPMRELGDFPRMVRRNDATVPAVVVGGRVAVRAGTPADLGHGRFLAAGAAAPLPAPRDREPAEIVGRDDARVPRTARHRVDAQ